MPRKHQKILGVQASNQGFSLQNWESAGSLSSRFQDPSRNLGRHGHVEDGWVRRSLEGFSLGSIQRPLDFHDILSGLPCPAVNWCLKCSSPVNDTKRPHSRTVQNLNWTCPLPDSVKTHWRRRWRAVLSGSHVGLRTWSPQSQSIR